MVVSALELIFFFIGAMAVRKLTQLTAPPLPIGRGAWLSFHQKHLQASLEQARWGGPLLGIQIVVVGNLFQWDRVPFLSLIACIACSLALAGFRTRRLRRELEDIQARR